MKNRKLILSSMILMLLVGCSANEDAMSSSGTGSIGTDNPTTTPVVAGALTKYDAAHYIADKLEISDFDAKISDVSKDDSKTLAVISRDIFGEFGKNAKFNGRGAFTRYQLATSMINTYAYLECVNDENLEPGEINNISDMEELSPRQRWYVNSALSYGFVEPIEDGIYDPSACVSLDELEESLDKVLELSENEPLGLKEFRAKRLENFRACPSKPLDYEEKLDFYYRTNNRYETILATSLQGLVNRDSIKVLIEDPNDLEMRDFIYDYAIKNNYIGINKNEYDNVYTLLDKYYSKYNLNKFVVFNPAKPWQINTATDICAAEGRLIIATNQVDFIKERYSDTDMLYIDDLKLKNQYEAQGYTYNNYYEYLRRDILGMNYYGDNMDVLRDYNIQMKFPTLWVPGSNSPDYDSRAIGQMAKIMTEYPANIPLYGFSFSQDNVDGIPTDVGIGEYNGVEFYGQYSKYMCVHTTVGNLSFHTSFRPDPEKVKYTKPVREYKEYNPNKKYVAITMQESGDSPMYVEHFFYDYQWKASERGKIKSNFSYGLCNIDLLPMHTEYFMQTKTDNDVLYGAISGIGYMYPLVTFGTRPLMGDNGIYGSREEFLKDHYIKANELMKRLGFESMAVYSYSNAKWSEKDYNTFDDNCLKYLTECKYVMADMHRPVGFNNPLPIHQSKFGQYFYHCSTFWDTSDYGRPNTIDKDKEAVNSLTNEIIAHTRKPGFYQCMAYSWHFGPRRLKMVMDEIERRFPGQYEFVNIDELDHYYREYKKVN